LYDGNKLLAICSEGDGFDGGLCEGYVVAVFDVLSDGSAIGGWKACNPANLKSVHVKAIVVIWLRDHPESRHLSASSLVAAALSEAFPCP
jgi:hypothetical protein